jgi:hypothetical protein
MHAGATHAHDGAERRRHPLRIGRRAVGADAVARHGAQNAAGAARELAITLRERDEWRLTERVAHSVGECAEPGVALGDVGEQHAQRNALVRHDLERKRGRAKRRHREQRGGGRVGVGGRGGDLGGPQRAEAQIEHVLGQVERLLGLDPAQIAAVHADEANARLGGGGGTDRAELRVHRSAASRRRARQWRGGALHGKLLVGNTGLDAGVSVGEIVKERRGVARQRAGGGENVVDGAGENGQFVIGKHIACTRKLVARGGDSTLTVGDLGVERVETSGVKVNAALLARLLGFLLATKSRTDLFDHNVVLRKGRLEHGVSVIALVHAKETQSVELLQQCAVGARRCEFALTCRQCFEHAGKVGQRHHQHTVGRRFDPLRIEYAQQSIRHSLRCICVA